MTIEAEVSAIMLDAGWSTSMCRKGETLPFARFEGAYWIVNGRPNGVDDHVGVAGPGAEYHDPVALAYALVDRAKSLQRAQAALVATAALSVVAPVVVEPVIVEPVEAIAEPVPTVDLAAENEALRRRIAELEAIEAPLLPAPDALMADWGEVGAYPGIPDDFVQLMTGEETLEQAVERMTLGVDELLDMATVLSDQSLELALCTVPPERVNEWTEKLITEKARLRRLRGTVDENFGRENLVSRVQGMFAQVGAKR